IFLRQRDAQEGVGVARVYLEAIAEHSQRVGGVVLLQKEVAEARQRLDRNVLAAGRVQEYVFGVLRPSQLPRRHGHISQVLAATDGALPILLDGPLPESLDRKSTRLNSSH